MFTEEGAGAEAQRVLPSGPGPGPGREEGREFQSREEHADRAGADRPGFP